MMLDSCTERQTRSILQYFRSLGELGNGMSPSSEIGQTLASTVSAMVEMFGLSRAALLAAHGPDGHLLPVVTHGLELEYSEPVDVPQSIRRSLIRRSRLRPVRSLPSGFVEGLIESVGIWARDAEPTLVALIHSYEVVGLFLFDRGEESATLPERDGDVLCGMCQNIAVYLHNQVVLGRLTQKRREVNELYERVRDVYKQAVMAFLTAIDIKDGYTREHSLRVARMSSVIARDVGFTDHEAEGIYFAGLLHDIGKILVDKQILTKPGTLDLTEYAEMSQHTRLGAQIIDNIKFPWENLVYAVRHHHDRPNYEEEFSPRQCRHFDMGIKIVGLIDAFDAMTSDRPYRRALGMKETLAEIIDCLGGQFDPEITRAFLKVLEHDIGRPPHQRRILDERLLRDGLDRLRDILADALQQVESIMGIITTY